MNLTTLTHGPRLLAALAGLLVATGCGGSGGGGKERTLTVTVSIAAEGPIEGTRDQVNNIAETNLGLEVGDREAQAIVGPVRAFLSFNRSTVPPEATITHAWLQLNLVSVSGSPFAAGQLGNLMVDSVNYGDAFPDSTSYLGNTILGNLAVLATTPTLGVRTATVTFGVVNDHQQNRPRSQFRLKFLDRDQNFDAADTLVHFVDAEDALTQGSPPALVITYTIPNPN
jgi:hypothetical protein